MNYDEIIESSPSEEQSTIAAEIDRAIREWAHEIDASVAKVKDSRYSMTFENKYMSTLREGKFAILDRMHEIQTKADFPTTISLGIAVGESELSKLQERNSRLVSVEDRAVKKNSIHGIFYSIYAKIYNTHISRFTNRNRYGRRFYIGTIVFK
mgnify:CR=1 FL=1